jgi:hypothetical protein
VGNIRLWEDYVVVERDQVIRSPDHIDDVHVAAWPLGGLTAWRSVAGRISTYSCSPRFTRSCRHSRKRSHSARLPGSTSSRVRALVISSFLDIKSAPSLPFPLPFLSLTCFPFLTRRVVIWNSGLAGAARRVAREAARWLLLTRRRHRLRRRRYLRTGQQSAEVKWKSRRLWHVRAVLCLHAYIPFFLFLPLSHSFTHSISVLELPTPS